MKEMLEKVKVAFIQKGYRKRRNSFYKTEDGFYKLINFQKGAYGDYFYINVGLHPIGLPILQANALLIPDHRTLKKTSRRNCGRKKMQDLGQSAKLGWW